MADYFNKTGALCDLLSRLRSVGSKMSSLEEIENFKDNLDNIPELIKNESNKKYLEDIEILKSEIGNLELELEESVRRRKIFLEDEKNEIIKKLDDHDNSKELLTKVVAFFAKSYWEKRRDILENKFEEETSRPFKKMINEISSLQAELEDRVIKKSEWIEKISKPEMTRFNSICSVLEENMTLFFGAKGEERALGELEKLPDSYTVINNYSRRFNPPVYDRHNNDKIFSIQLDHIAVGPTGIFLIETKNWSKGSVENLDLFSPVKQLKRSSFAMFCVLNRAVRRQVLESFNVSWGERMISPKNVILLISNKPNQEFQHVKLLTLPEVNKYITYGQQTFSDQEVAELVDYLNRTNENNNE